MLSLVKTTLNGLDELYLLPDRADRQEWRSTLGWEKARHQSMKQHITARDVVYYAGAEEGEFPALCAKWGAHVTLFEPNPAMWSRIKQLWHGNTLPAPRCYPGFASNDTTTDQLDGTPWPHHADHPPEEQHGFKELYLEAKNYPQYKIDAVVEYSGVIPTALIMDVEGSEFEVLKGAEQTIDRYKPRIWLSLHPEFLFHQWGVYASELRGWLTGKGYEETLLDYKHEVHLFYEA